MLQTVGHFDSHRLDWILLHLVPQPKPHLE